MERDHSGRPSPFGKNRTGLLPLFFLSAILSSAPARGETSVEAPLERAETVSAEAIDPAEAEEARARQALYRAIGKKLDADARREAIGLIDRYFQEHPVTEKNFVLLAMKAEVLLEMNELEKAIAVYQKNLLPVLKMEEEMQRKFAFWMMALGGLYQRSGEYGKAISLIEKGLVLDPGQTVRTATGGILRVRPIPIRIVLGEAYIEAGKNGRAVDLYQKLLEAPELTEEEGVVIRIKLKRLGAPVAGPPFPRELAQAPFYKRFTIRLLPINGAGLAIRLKDICALLESKFLVRCEVLKPIDFREKTISAPGTALYDSGKIVELLGKLYPNPKGKRALLIAATGREIVGQKNDGAFSWLDPDRGIGLFSSKEFSPIDPTYEPEVIPTRRAAIRMLSVVSDLLGWTPATVPPCPASAGGPPDLSVQSPPLCEPALLQRDAFLNGLRTKPGRFDPEQLLEIERVYEKYSFR